MHEENLKNQAMISSITKVGREGGGREGGKGGRVSKHITSFLPTHPSLPPSLLPSLPFQPCPGCGNPAEKAGGCNQISCVWCGKVSHSVLLTPPSLPPFPFSPALGVATL